MLKKQLLKMLFLYTQSEKDRVEKYSHNFTSLWNTIKLFGGLPGVRKGLVEGALKSVRGTSNAVQIKQRRGDNERCTEGSAPNQQHGQVQIWKVEGQADE